MIALTVEDAAIGWVPKIVDSEQQTNISQEKSTDNDQPDASANLIEDLNNKLDSCIAEIREIKMKLN